MDYLGVGLFVLQVVPPLWRWVVLHQKKVEGIGWWSQAGIPYLDVRKRGRYAELLFESYFKIAFERDFQPVSLRVMFSGPVLDSELKMDSPIPGIPLPKPALGFRGRSVLLRFTEPAIGKGGRLELTVRHVAGRAKFEEQPEKWEPEDLEIVSITSF